jgi:hypothetical protein
MATSAAAGPVRGIELGAGDAIAVRGGVLMVPLVAQQPGDRWPARLELRLDDGRTLEGLVAWVEPSAAPRRARWTDDSRPLAVRPIAPADDTAAGGGGGAPVLLARLPADGAGAAHLERQPLLLRWVDRPEAVAAGQPAMAAEPAHDRPDPDDPFEHWRWVLLARSLERAAPDAARFGGPAALVAQHVADLWEAGLERLRQVDARAAARCLELLTRVCRDREVSIAAWVADPGQTAALLALLHQPRSAAEVLAAQARAWCEAQPEILMWLESAGPDEVVLAMINRGAWPAVARLRWSGPGELPAAAEIEPGMLTRVHVDRPAAESTPEEPGPLTAPAAAASPPFLAIDVGARSYAITVGPRVEAAQPPAAFAGALRPPLTLAEVHTGQSAPPSAHLTTVQVRRRLGRWEVFVECKFPGGAAGAAAEDGPADTVTLFVGPEAGGVALVIPQRGEPRLAEGTLPEELQVHRRTHPDRWACRVVLPRRWLEAAPEATLLGALRVCEGGPPFQTAPGASTPWRPVVGRRALDLRGW